MSGQPEFLLFETPIGACALAWGEAGLIGVHLPEASDQKARARIARRFPGVVERSPPAWVALAVRRILAVMAGARDSLRDIPIDETEVSAFQSQVYGHARTIAPGETRTYGQIATALGDPLLARAVGVALGQNPWPIVVPCHRVLGADGKAGGFSANGGLATKTQLLNLEGARIGDAPSLFDALPLAIAPRRTDRR